MKTRDKDNGQFCCQEADTFIEKLKVVGSVGLPLWFILFFLCLVGISECQDKRSTPTHTYPPYDAEEFRHGRSEQYGKRNATTTLPGSESRAEKVFETEDFYDVYDYNGGLDGEFSGIDYNDITDYYAD